MLFAILPLLLIAQAAIDWDAPALHFETTDITTQSRKELKSQLELQFKDIKNFRADTAIGKDGVIVTGELRLSSIKAGDVIKSIDGTNIAVCTDLTAVLKTLTPGVFVQVELLRPTPKGNRANYAKTTVEYAPTSEYLLTLAAFEARELKATKQTVYIPVGAEMRKAIFLQLVVGPGNKVTEQIVFNRRRPLGDDQMASIALFTDSQSIRIASLNYDPERQFEKKEKYLSDRTTREWVEVDVTQFKDLAPMLAGDEKITLQFSSEIEVKFDLDVSDSLRDSKLALDKLKAALKSRAKQ